MNTRRCRLSTQGLLDRAALPVRQQVQVLLNTKSLKVLVLRHPTRDARKELPPHMWLCSLELQGPGVDLHEQPNINKVSMMSCVGYLRI